MPCGVPQRAGRPAAHGCDDWSRVSVQGRLPTRRHRGVLCSRSLSVIALEMALRLIDPPRRNRSVRFDQFEVAEATRPTRRGLRAQALVEYRPGGLDSFAAPVALIHVALDRHLASPSAAAARKLPIRDVCPIPGTAKRSRSLWSRRRRSSRGGEKQREGQQPPATLGQGESDPRTAARKRTYPHRPAPTPHV